MKSHPIVHLNLREAASYTEPLLSSESFSDLRNMRQWRDRSKNFMNERTWWVVE